MADSKIDPPPRNAHHPHPHYRHPNNNHRLRLLLFLLKESATRRLCCAHCRRPLATKPTVFSVPGAEGTVGAYVNAHGFVHQTLTLRELLSPERVVLDGQPESRDSWFGGYAWQIAYCARCMLHLGWYFTPQQEQLEHEQEATPSASAAAAAPTASSPHRPRSHSQPPDRPPFFWGLRRAALVDETLDAPADDEEIDAALLWLVEAGGHMDGDSDSQTDAADGGGEVEEGSSGGGGGGGETSREASEEEED